MHTFYFCSKAPFTELNGFKHLFNRINMKFLLMICQLVVVIASSTENTESTTPSLKNVVLSYPQEVSTAAENDLDDGICREISLHKCGSSMVRVFRLLDFLPFKRSYEAKCALRKAFFKCMKVEDEPCKKRHWRFSHSARFRKKLVRSLWSTRGCVLGLKSDGTQIS